MLKYLVSIIIINCLIVPQNANCQTWSSVGSGLGGNAYAFAVDTPNNELYVAGWFLSAGGNSAPYIAKWDGTSWTSVGGGMNYDNLTSVRCLRFFNGELYAGGSFDSAGGVPANNIAKWNGSNWSAVGSGLNRPVYTFEVYNGELYAGGSFDSSGTSAVSYIAKWDGTNWVDVGGGVDYVALTLCSYNNDLYAGGYFTHAGGINAYRVAKWNGVNWDTVGAGFNAVVRKLYVYNNELYAGGDFTPVPLNASYIISKLNSNTWQALPSPTGGNYPTIRDFVSFNGGLYVTGDFFTPSRIAKFNGSSYDSLGPGLSWVGYSLYVYKNELYVGGSFAWVGNSIPNTAGLAKWNSTVGVFENIIIDYSIIFPNPFNKQVTFRIPQNTDIMLPCNLIIYNELGKNIEQISGIEGCSYTMQRGDLTSGIYFYELRDKTSSLIARGKMIAN